MTGAWLSLERRSNDDDKYRIWVVAHVEDQKPFRIGTVPKNIAFWLAPKMDIAEKAARKNKTKKHNEYYVHAEDLRIVGGGSVYFGVRFTLLYEIQKGA